MIATWAHRRAAPHTVGRDAARAGAACASELLGRLRRNARCSVSVTPIRMPVVSMKACKLRLESIAMISAARSALLSPQQTTSIGQASERAGNTKSLYGLSMPTDPPVYRLPSELMRRAHGGDPGTSEHPLMLQSLLRGVRGFAAPTFSHLQGRARQVPRQRQLHRRSASPRRVSGSCRTTLR